MSFLSVGGSNYLYDSAEDIVTFTASQLDQAGNRRPFMGSVDEINKVKMMQLSKVGVRQSQHLLNIQKQERIHKGSKRAWAPLSTVLVAAGKFRKSKDENGGALKKSDSRSMLHQGMSRIHETRALEQGSKGPPQLTDKKGWDKLRNSMAFSLHKEGGRDKDEKSVASSIMQHILRTRKHRVPDALRKRCSSSHTLKEKESRRWSTVAIEVEKPIIRWKRDGEAKAYFRRQARKVSIVLSWAVILKSYNDTMGEELKSFMDIAREIKETTAMKNIEEKAGLAFDPNEFKADKEVQLSSECVSILTLPAYARTPDMVTKVIANLKTLRSFQEYPTHMQEKLAKVAWYQILDPRRLILREGHYAENFYFILSGEAVVKKILKDPKTGQMQMTALAVLQKGKSFGEIALLNHSRRTASIETGTTTKMLVVSRGDFLSIFMNMKDGEEPDHVKFLRNCGFTKHFPVGKLMLFPGVCMFHYFGRSTTVVADSNENQWLYIVKTGSCRVIKKLNAVAPQKCWGSKRRVDTNLSTAWLDPASPKIDSWHRARAKSAPDITVLSGSQSSQFFATQSEDNNLGKGAETKNKENGSNAVDRRRGAPYISQNGNDNNVLPLLALVNKSKDGTDNFDDKTRIHPLGDYRNTQPDDRFSRSKGVSFLPKLIDSNIRPVTVPPAMPKLLKRATAAKPLEKKPEKPKGNGSIYVQLRSLKPGDVFGLEDIEFEDEPFEYPRTSVTLASNGAELIMLSKKIFIKMANEHVQRYVREHRRLFPGDDNLQENLQTEMNWRLYREATTDQITDFANDLHGRSISA